MRFMNRSQTPAEQERVGKGGQKRLALLDAHAILHRAYHALPNFASSRGEPTGALYGLATMLIKILSDLKPDYVAACYDLPGPTYRHEAYEAYKIQRKKAPEELIHQMKRSRDIFKAMSIPIYERQGFEADDIIGTIVEKLKGNRGIEIVIASGDMDTLQLVSGKKVTVYTLKKGIQDVVLYDEEKVRERFGFSPERLPDFKGLQGDPSDNVPGIKGIGEKTAGELVRKFGTIEEIYQVVKKERSKLLRSGLSDRTFKLLSEGEEEALFSKMLTTIRKDVPIEFDLPARRWLEELNPEAVSDLFSELEFRTLTSRLRDAFVLAGREERRDGFEFKAEAPPEKLVRESGIALWLLNSNLTNPTLEDILQFGRFRDFKAAREVILSELEKQGIIRVYREIELPLVSIIERMQERGVKINTVYLGELSKSYHGELGSLQEKIWQLAGEKFNINSPKQLGAILFEKLMLSARNIRKTEGGARSTRESELLKLRGSNPIIDLILSHRELQKLLSTYIDNIPTMLDARSRLHTTFIQAGTTTGRMASENPNLQNIPIRSEFGARIRKAFVAEEGFLLVGFDYSQIQLRIAAMLSGDPKLIEIFKRGEDVHKVVASEVFNVPTERVDAEMRRRAKVINFGILYGMGVNALRQNLGTSREIAQTFYSEFFKDFEVLAQYLDAVKAESERRGYTETLFGRRRYLEGLRSPIPYIRAEAERMAVNAPIQGTEADIMKLAMVRVDNYLRMENLSKDAHMIIQVHDELLFEIREGLVERLSPEIKHIMEGVITLEESRGVPVVVDVSVGKSWGEMLK